MNVSVKNATARLFLTLALAALRGGDTGLAAAETNSPSPSYHIYSGSTHSHSAYTWSHGEQWMKSPVPRMLVTEGVSYPGTNNVTKTNWQRFQGPPAAHFALAKSNRYDFYVVSDHSQEASFQPVTATNAAWLATRRDAATATDSHFAALAGFEHSENNGPRGKGHLNVINSARYLNALSPGVDLPYFYRWLKTVSSNGDGPVVASFNHPGLHQYDGWADRDPEITDIITLLEVINSNRTTPARFATLINALDKGWKVSPVSGGDNHGFSGIPRHAARTFVLATNLTKAAILDAMKHRRTYASLDKNIQCRYTVNGAIMGSTLDRPTVFQFDITISDPDTDKLKAKITKIDVVKDGGEIAQSYSPTPDHSIHWTPTLSDSTNKYFLVRVWNVGGGDTPEADPEEPVAWLAPIWTGR